LLGILWPRTLKSSGPKPRGNLLGGNMQCILIIFMVSQMSYVAAGAVYNSVRVIPREQEEETLIRGKTVFGLYGGPVVKFTELDNDFAVLVGGRGGLIINHTLVIGCGGYNLANHIDVMTPEHHLLDLGYGGIFFEYIMGSRKLFHLSIHSLIGGGGLCYREYYYEPWYDDMFFVAEPGADLMLNISRHFRMGLGGSYRFIYGIDLAGLSDAAVSAPSASLTLKFGFF